MPSDSPLSLESLTPREREVLRLVVQSFVETADPVGSRALVKRFNIGLSPASIRNTMSDLEDAGYLRHPYTSAGRVPTELGYRTFVSELMESSVLSPQDKHLLHSELERLRAQGDTSRVFSSTTKLLGRLSNLLGVVLTPGVASGVLERIEIVPLYGARVLFVLSVKSGPVKTIVLELDLESPRADLERVVQVLNERLAGLSLEEVRKTYADRVRDLHDERTGVVRLVLRNAPELFAEVAPPQIQMGTTEQLLEQPEFRQPEDLRTLIRLLEDRKFMVQLISELPVQGDGIPAGAATVCIGRETMDEDPVRRFSLVTAHYRMGSLVGTVGVIGPVRMDYARVVAVVEYMAKLLGQPDPDTLS